MRRKRSQQKPKQKKKHTQPAYPDPETRQEIVAQREQILTHLLLGVEKPSEIIEDLSVRYGEYQVRYVLNTFLENLQPTFLVDGATVYRHYRWLFAHFGGHRPFLAKQ